VAAVYTIPPGIPFARALAEGILERAGRDPLTLADTLVFVPTRRAARTLRECFAEARGAVLGPRIAALGDTGEEDAFDAAGDDIAAPPVIAPLRRRLVLATLVQRWSARRGEAMPMAQAVAHAGELGRFLDEAIERGADLSRLGELAPQAYAAHWQDVLAFLRIVAEQWPAYLGENGLIEGVARRDARLRRLAARLKADQPETPVIAAGSTGSIPATAELLDIVARLPKGAVVLPGLDTDLDDAAWGALDPGHAQYGLRELIDHIGIARGDVASWTPLPGEDPNRCARAHFLAEALRPPPTTDAWRTLADGGAAPFANALDGFAVVEADHPREEAGVIALALRGALETPGRTAALVTPDRGLARRVAAELRRWDIDIDDSAGTPLARTPPGALLSLLARAAEGDFAPVPLLALLKHPLASGGMKRIDFLHRVRAFEDAVLRGLRPAPGLDGIATALARAPNAPDALRAWWKRLAAMLAPFADATNAEGEVALGTLVEAHGRAAEALAATDERSGARILWQGDAGEEAANLMREIAAEAADIAIGDARHYAELFGELARARTVRPAFGRHPRLAILGPLEARLQNFDLVVLGGLNEGTWPAEAATDPWLSRPMRAQFGLEPPERRIGLAAHDFASLAAAPNVLLTRARKENGAPSVPSRWVLRVRSLAKGLGLSTEPAEPWLAWVRRLDTRERTPRAARPAPKPPTAARPNALRVTEIETWLRDPYAIYARHVLDLRPRDPIDREPGPKERGTAIHKVLEKFLIAYPADFPPDAPARLLALGEEEFAREGANAATLALWRPRFARAARWFLDYERARRARIARSFVECAGTLAVTDGFTLTGRADRIDLLRDGTAAILDYKTGGIPSHKQVETLLAPQLPLEAAMLLAGGFADGPAVQSVSELVYVRLTGGVPAGQERAVGVAPDAKAAEARAKLAARVAQYADPATPYPSRAMPFKKDEERDYDHLARVREWSVYGEPEE